MNVQNPVFILLELEPYIIFLPVIQGKLVKNDFNIEDEAGGVGKAIIKNFTASVTSHTLDIRFYWGGKGTTGIPQKGVYGPLISAISVTSGKSTIFGASSTHLCTTTSIKSLDFILI